VTSWTTAIPLEKPRFTQLLKKFSRFLWISKIHWQVRSELHAAEAVKTILSGICHCAICYRVSVFQTNLLPSISEYSNPSMKKNGTDPGRGRVEPQETGTRMV
jgi:hypothetical protein